MRRAAAFALPALLLAGCAAASQAPAQTDALTIENRYPLEYAKQFTVDVCAGGYDLITIDGSRYLVVPEGAAAPADLDAIAQCSYCGVRLLATAHASFR